METYSADALPAASRAIEWNDLYSPPAVHLRCRSPFRYLPSGSSFWFRLLSRWSCETFLIPPAAQARFGCRHSAAS